MEAPVIEARDCVLCEVCTEVCPSVFRLNDLGYIEVIDMPEYPEAEIHEAIKNCPKDCIFRMEQ